MERSDRTMHAAAWVVFAICLAGAPAMAADDKTKPPPKADRPSAETRTPPPSPPATAPSPPPFLPSERLSTGRSVSFPNDI